LTHAAALELLRFAHTIIFVAATSGILWMVVGGLRDRLDRGVWAGLIASAGIGLALMVNGCECPLQTLAQRLAGVDHWVSDIYLPEPVADAVVPVATPVTLLGFALVGWRIRRRRAAGRPIVDPPLRSSHAIPRDRPRRETDRAGGGR